ncbi:MAG: phosphate acyltransferase PlsX [Solirubrobacterales bacterium]|nr:phosphate acyltransferase PlsX [Solirubrobacterales bacterium]
MTQTVVVAVDAGGADAGPAEVSRAAELAAVEHRVRVLLFGPASALGTATPNVEVHDAPLSIAKHPDPARAVRAHPEASVVQAVRAVAEGRADALVAGGSTGAALAAGLFRIKRAPGVHRPALAMRVPAPDHPFLMLDVGANTAVRPEHLVQFAHMGSAYAELLLGLESPRVALLSNGEEATKGSEDVVAAHALLGQASAGLNFIGNVEGFGIATGAADVIVCDGFTGNVVIKMMEGASSALMGAIRGAAEQGARFRLGGLLLRPALRGVREAVDPERQGGAMLLGLRKPVVVPHGSFGARGIAAAVGVAARAVREDLGGRTHAALEAGGALRTREVTSAAPGSLPGIRDSR